MVLKSRLPALALATISICLSIAVIGCAGRPLHVFHAQQTSNAWFLPVWPSHFETRELQTLISTSALVVVLNALLVASLLLHTLPAITPLLAAALSSICALVALALPAALNSHAPTRDTLQTWTCRWAQPAHRDAGPPADFAALCHETRFAFYASIPLLLLQLALLTLAVLAQSARARAPAARRLYDEPEKADVELASVRRVAVEPKR